MSQTIQHRRGPKGNLSAFTPAEGEIIISSGSSPIGGYIAHVGDGATAGGFAVGRLFTGGTAPSVSGYGSAFDDVLWYDSGSKTLVRLDQAGNETLDLSGAVGASDLQATMDSGSVAVGLVTDVIISGSSGITIQSQTDAVDIGTLGDELRLFGNAGISLQGVTTVSGNLNPAAHLTYDLGADGNRWDELYVRKVKLGTATTTLEDGFISSSADLTVNADNILNLTSRGNAKIEMGLYNDNDVSITSDSGSFAAGGALYVASSEVALYWGAQSPIRVNDDGAYLDYGPRFFSQGNEGKVFITNENGVSHVSTSFDETTSLADTRISIRDVFSVTATTQFTGSVNVTGDVTANAFSGSFSGSFTGPSSTTLQEVLDNGSVGTATGNITLNTSGGTFNNFRYVNGLVSNGFSHSPTSILISATDTGGVGAMTMNFSFGGGMVISDSAFDTGLKYQADYSLTGSLNPRWIPDYGAVQSAISSGTSATASYSLNTLQQVLDNGSDATITSDLNISTSGRLNLTSSANDIDIYSDAQITLGTSDTGGITITDTNVFHGVGVEPDADGTMDLGSDTKAWRTLYADSGSFNGSVLIKGDLTVHGTQSIVNSEVVTINDNIIVVNADSTAGVDGGMYVFDNTATQYTASILWDATGDYWKAGTSGSENRMVLQESGSNLANQTLPVANPQGNLVDSNITTDGSTVTITGDLSVTGTANVTASLAETASYSLNGLQQVLDNSSDVILNSNLTVTGSGTGVGFRGLTNYNIFASGFTAESQLVPDTFGDQYVLSTSVVNTRVGKFDVTGTAYKQTLEFESNAITFTDSQNSKGVVYAADYSANYTSRSLVDQEYVDNAVSSGVGSATLQDIMDNGSTWTGTSNVFISASAANIQLSAQSGDARLTLEDSIAQLDSIDGGQVIVGDEVTINTPAGINLSGSQVNTPKIIPNATDIHDLGSAAANWNTLYVNTVSASNEVKVSSSYDSGNALRTEKGELIFQHRHQSGSATYLEATDLSNNLLFQIQKNAGAEGPTIGIGDIDEAYNLTKVQVDDVTESGKINFTFNSGLYTITMSGSSVVTEGQDATVDLGNPSERWRNIYAQQMSGSFIGDGSGLTGVVGEWDGTHVGNAQITGSLTLSGSAQPLTINGIQYNLVASAAGLSLTDKSGQGLSSFTVGTGGAPQITLGDVDEGYNATLFELIDGTKRISMAVDFEVIEFTQSAFTPDVAADGNIDLGRTTSRWGQVHAVGFSGSFNGDGSALTNLGLAATASYVAGANVDGAVDLATNLVGGAANQIAYQTAANTTGFITAPTTDGDVLQYNGASMIWSNVIDGGTF